MLYPLQTPAHLTRREALAAERRTHARTRGQATRPVRVVAVRSGQVPVGAPRPAARTAVLPLVGAAAALLRFTVNTTPAVAAASTSAGTEPVAVIAPHGQSYTAPATRATQVARDRYSVTAPVPVAKAGTSTVGASRSTSRTTAAPAPASGTGAVRRPFPGMTKTSSPFGYRSAPCSDCTSFPGGTDLTPGAGTPIGAVAAGTVAISGWHPYYGQYVIIDHLIDGRKISTLYGHMQAGSSPLRVGDTVTAGSLVGFVGNNDISTGAHLHLEIRLDGTLPIDPMIWLAAHGG